MMRKWAKATAIRLGLAGLLVIGLLSPLPRSWADYLGTVPGSGTNFASVGITVASVVAQYTAFLLCDPTAGKAQCAGINSSGQIAIQAPPTLPLPSGAATSATQGTTTDVPCTLPATATACTQIAIAKAEANGINSPANFASQYPATAVPITTSATGTTGATTATLTNVTGHTTYICGFSIRANATAAATNNATVTGTITGTLNFTQWTAPLASGIGVTEEIFGPCVPASAVSTSIAVVSGAPGSGGVVSVTAWGYSI